MIMGNFDMRVLIKSDYFIGFIFLISFLFLGKLYVMNMIIANFSCKISEVVTYHMEEFKEPKFLGICESLKVCCRKERKKRVENRNEEYIVKKGSEIPEKYQFNPMSFDKNDVVKNLFNEYKGTVNQTDKIEGVFRSPMSSINETI